MGYIYKITNTVTNLEYVGKTINDINKRLDEHIRSGRLIASSSQVAKSLREYGSFNHRIEVLEVCEDSVLLEREQHWIDELNTLHVGLNIKNEYKLDIECEFWGDPEKAKQNTDNNDVWNKGISPPEGVRKKISETKRKRHALGLYKSYGHSHTEETKKKLSDIAKNREPITDTTRNKISEGSKDRKFYHNVSDKNRINIKSNDPIPDGYVEGKGMVWITKDKQNLNISVWDLDEYINCGYERGRYVFRKNC